MLWADDPATQKFDVFREGCQQHDTHTTQFIFLINLRDPTQSVQCNSCLCFTNQQVTMSITDSDSHGKFHTCVLELRIYLRILNLNPSR